MNRTLAIPFASALALALAGCKSPTGVDRAEDTAASMRSLHGALMAAPDKITAVSTSLEDLAKGGGDMKAEFATFEGKVDALVSHREQIRNLRSEVEASKAAFTSEWQKSLAGIKDADLRKRAEERQAAVVEQFGELSKLGDSGREEFEPWLQKVIDVRKYLENDLNQSGVDSVRDTVRQITNGAASVNKKITAVVEGLQQMADQIAATKPPAPGSQPQK